MSRSIRAPVVVASYGWSGKSRVKTAASRIIRHLDVDTDIGNGNSYRRHYPQWDICDYRWMTNDPVLARK